MRPPNGLGFSRAAPIDRESTRAGSSLQNRPDLACRHAASATTTHPTRRTSVRKELHGGVPEQPHVRRPFIGILISNLGCYLRRVGLNQHVGWNTQARMQAPDHR
jgi:hypothetical protein